MLYFEKFLGLVNTERTPPIIEAGGKAWCTRGAKGGRTPVIALMHDQMEGEENVERLPSGVTADDGHGNQVVVP